MSVPRVAESNTHITASQFRLSAQEVMQPDLSPLFLTIVAQLIPEPGGRSLSIPSIVQDLSQDRNVLQQLTECPVGEIRKQFHTFSVSIDQPKNDQTRAWQVLNDLYCASLMNSSISTQLSQRIEELPGLRQTLQEKVKERMESAVRQTDQIFNRANKVKTLEQINRLLKWVDQTLTILNSYRVLKHFQDSEENQRLVDLARYYEGNGEQQYSAFIADYPKIVDLIAPLQKELDAVSSCLLRLAQLKLTLLKKCAELQGPKEKISSLQSRFIDPFASAFYQAFAAHFWNIILNPQTDPEIVEAMKSNPHPIQQNEIDYVIVHGIWGICFPQYEMTQWMERSLSSMSENELAVLEKKLQELDKSSNEAKLTLGLDKEAKAQIQASSTNEMAQICSQIIPPLHTSVQQIRGSLRDVL